MAGPVRHKIREALEFLRLPGPGLIEIVAIYQQGDPGPNLDRIVSGIFDDLDRAIDAAALLDDEGKYSLYAVINPVGHHVLQRDNRALNALARPSGLRAKKGDATSVQTILVDIDPKNKLRPGTDVELKVCEQAARDALALVTEHSGAALLHTGSGVAIWFRVDLPPGDDSQDLVKNLHSWLSEKVRAHEVELDAVSDQCRLTALPGTTKRKRKNPDRTKPPPPFSTERPPRPVKIVETFTGVDPGAFERFLRSLPRSKHRAPAPPATGPSPSTGIPSTASVTDLCPGWLKVLDTIDEWPFGHDQSSSATAWRLSKAMQSRTAMDDTQIAEVIQGWGEAFANSYEDPQRATTDVARILSKIGGEPLCEDVAQALGPGAPCLECPEFLYRSASGLGKLVIVRPSLPTYSRPPLGDHLRDPLGDSLGEARWRLSGSIEDAVVWALEHRPTGLPVDVVLLYRVGAGVGKTHQAVHVMEKLLSQPGPPRFIYLTESYRTALDVLTQLQGTPVAQQVLLFHPKLTRPLTNQAGRIDGFCERPNLIAAARADGARSDYQLACRKCPELATCRYRGQFDRPESYIAVHDHAMSLLGPRADRGNLPTTGIFDEDPRRIYQPDIEVVTEDDLQQLEAAHPVDAPALVRELRAATAGKRSAPQPLVVDREGFRTPGSTARGALEQLAQVSLTGKPRRLVRALRGDADASGRPYQVWVAPPDHPFRVKHKGQQAKGGIGVVTVNRFRLHREVLALVLDATAHPGILEAGLGREVKADTDQVRARCEVWQIPVNTSWTVLSSVSSGGQLRRNIRTLLQALDAHHTQTDPMGLITYQRAMRYFPEARGRKAGRITGYFHGVRGSNAFHDRGVHEMVIVGTPVPNLTSFDTLATTYAQEYEKRIPDASWTRRFVASGLRWEGLDVAMATMAYDDPTMQALLDRECAAELYQAAFRIRPHVNGAAKRIWLIGLQPIWDLPTTRLLTFEQAIKELGGGRSPGRPASATSRATGYIDQQYRSMGKLPTVAEIIQGTSVSESSAKRARRKYKAKVNLAQG